MDVPEPTNPDVTPAIPSADDKPPTDRKRSGKDPYPVPDTGLTAWPDDFDSSKHGALKESDFSDPTIFFQKKIDDETERFNKRVEKHRSNIALYNAFKGDKKAVQNAKNAVKAFLSFQQFSTELNEMPGVDTKMLLKALHLPDEVLDVLTKNLSVVNDDGDED